MACEISPICNSLFGSLGKTLLTDMVDVELTIWMVKGIYTYRKDHTAESTVFTPWNKKVTPFFSLRCKIQAFKDDQRDEKVLQRVHAFQFLAPPVTQTNPQKRAPGKFRTKIKRPNTPNLPMTNMDTTDSNKVEAPLSVKVCDRFGLMY